MRKHTLEINRRTLLCGSMGLLILSACGSGDPGAQTTTLSISAIPDQKPEKLNRLYPVVAQRFASALKLKVSYRPVTDYTAVVRAFEIGDVHLAWMGGLTGVQARSRLAGAIAVAQRDIDAQFHSLFIASKTSGLQPFADIAGLRSLTGHTFTFGSETSTSGRLMPQHFMQQAGLNLNDLRGKPGFSGSHDATIAAVASGSFQAGAVNEQVWTTTQKTGTVDLSNVVVLWRTPAYADYHWLARPDLDQQFGAGTTQSIKDLLIGLDKSKPDDAAILELFGASSFIPTQNGNYDQIEAVARELGLLA